MTENDSIPANQYDVLIVGAGMVGLTAACLLAERVGDKSIRIGVVEANVLKKDVDCDSDYYDPRVSAITVRSQTLLDSIGAWTDIAAMRIAPFSDMQVWDAEGTGDIHFSAHDMYQEALGHIVENCVTISGLLAATGRYPCIEIIAPAKVRRIVSITNGMQKLMLEGGSDLLAPLVIAADGANSRIREMAEFDMREWEYGHHAIVTTVKTQKSHQQTAWQRFLPSGPLAFLPLENEHYCSIVWSCVPEKAEGLMALDDQAFCSALSASFENTLGEIESCERRFSFPLKQRHAKQYVKRGIVLVGDAAHTIHPLAGQGVNQGFKDADALADEIAKAYVKDADISSFNVLRRYQRRRIGDNLAMMGIMEGFKRLFEQDILPVRWLRNIGMSWMNKQPLIKQQIIKQAMGLD